MEIRYFYICDPVKHKKYDVRWYPGEENLDYYTIKHHLSRHHMQVHPIYLHMKNSQILLTRAMKPSNLRGCVGKAAGGYIRVHPYPLIHILIL